MASLWHRYAALFAQPGHLRFALLSLLMRMPLGTVGIGLLLHVRDLTGSIAFAGSVVGIELTAAAVTAPIMGRLADRHGPRTMLLVTGLLSPLALLLLLFAHPLGLSRSAMLVAGAVVGALSPPVTVLVRALWRHKLADEHLRHTAFALDSVAIEIAYTFGPLLIAVIVAVGTPQAALALAWVFLALAVPLLFASGGLAWWIPSDDGTARDLLGALRDPQLLRLYGVTLILTLAFGALEVGYQGFARSIGYDAWGPTLIAVNSIGSALGGLAYGGLHTKLPAERQLPLLAALFALPLGVHALLGSPWAMMPWALVAGLLIAPSMTAVSLLIAQKAKGPYATEAFTWSTTAIVTGVGAGMAIGGALAEHVANTAAFAFAAAAALIASGLALSLRRR